MDIKPTTHKGPFAFLWMLVLVFGVFATKAAFGETVPFRIKDEFSCDGVTIALDADIDYNHELIVPSYRARIKQWSAESLEKYTALIQFLSPLGTPIQYELEEGTVLLLNEERLERIAFLHDAQESFHYMTARSDLFYDNANNGLYGSQTIIRPDICDVFQSDNNSREAFEFIYQFFLGEGIEIGDALEMSTYYPSEEDGVDQVVVAFLQEKNGIRLMPWGQRLSLNDYTLSSYLLMYLDRDGITDIKIPMMFEAYEIEAEREIISLEQAVAALEDLYSASLIPPLLDDVTTVLKVDRIALEYAPIQQSNEKQSFLLTPVWSFYLNYDDDETRSVISLDAYTGKQVF